MKLRLIATLILVLLLPFGLSFMTTGAEANPEMQEPEVTSGVYDGVEPIPYERGAIFTDYAIHGTAWVRQNPGQFSMFKAMGWGIEAKAKAASDQWVHIPIPFTTVINGVPQKVSHIEFCAKSSHGAITKPTLFHVRTSQTLATWTNISWPADNNYHCYWINIAPTWYEDIGISVVLHFANATDKITLYKAWLRTVP